MARTPRPLITSEDLTLMRPEWVALHAAVPGATPFTHPAWHETWLRHFGRQFNVYPVHLGIRLEEQLLGVFALDIQQGVARTLGDANVRDYGGPLVLPGNEHTVARGVIEWLLEDLTPGLVAWGLEAETSVTGDLAEAADYWGWSTERVAESVCPAVDLACAFEEYVARLGKHDRHELRRKLRNLEAAGEVAFEVAVGPADIEARMDDLFRLMRQSSAAKTEFLTPAMETFFRDLAVEFAREGMTRLCSLRLDGHIVAVLFAFDCHGVRYLYNSGYDPAQEKLAVGLLSKALAIRDACERGLARFDFLRGDEPYKYRLGGTPREVITLSMRGRR